MSQFDQIRLIVFALVVLFFRQGEDYQSDLGEVARPSGTHRKSLRYLRT